MKSPLRALVVAFAFLLPCTANASELELALVEPSIFFGPAGATFGHGATPGFEDLFIDGVFVETPWFSSFSGELDFTAGPVVSLTVDASAPSSQYVFGPGTFSLTVHWTDQVGNPVQGQYVAPLLSLVIDVRCEQELAAFSCGDVHGDSLGDAFVSIGPGVFDDSLASILRLKPGGGAFDFTLALDGISGNPSDAFRAAGSAFGTQPLAIPVEVPEPSVLTLLLLSPALGLRFRR